MKPSSQTRRRSSRLTAGPAARTEPVRGFFARLVCTVVGGTLGVTLGVVYFVTALSCLLSAAAALAVFLYNCFAPASLWFAFTFLCFLSVSALAACVLTLLAGRALDAAAWNAQGDKVEL